MSGPSPSDDLRESSATKALEQRVVDYVVGHGEATWADLELAIGGDPFLVSNAIELLRRGRLLFIDGEKITAVPESQSGENAKPRIRD